jgi:nucleoside triphosphate pyrophosphatase
MRNAEWNQKSVYLRGMEIILASLSPRRAELLGRFGVRFHVAAPEGVDESAARGSAVEVATGLALRKADSVLAGRTRSEVLVIGADTVVESEGELLGKPRDLSHARSMIEKLSGRTHRVVTGIAVLARGKSPRIEAETSEVTFRRLSAEEIEDYLATGDPEGKAGAYGIQSEGRRLVEGFCGCYYNIVGLPIRRLLRILREMGANIPEGECDCGKIPLFRGVSGCRPEVINEEARKP